MYNHLIRTIIRAYPSRLIKLYVYFRFKIINPSIISSILNYFEKDRKLLVLGCGFGLFDICMGLRWPDKRIYGCDLNEKRIHMARDVAAKLKLRNNQFECHDARNTDELDGEFGEILLLDVLHHIPIEAQENLARKCHAMLKNEGCLVVKDIHRESAFRLFFTWILDMLMTNWEPVFYRSRGDMETLLEAAGFKVITIYIDDILPYPHIMYVCHKGKAGA